MRQILFILILSIGLAFNSCKKEDATIEFPDWLVERIQDLEIEDEYCNFCQITIDEYNGIQYYNLYCNHWSCLYCEFYDATGAQPEWDSDTWDNYQLRKTEIAIVRSCDWPIQ